MNTPSNTMPTLFGQSNSVSTGIPLEAKSIRNSWSEKTQEERRRRALYIQAKLSELLIATD